MAYRNKEERLENYLKHPKERLVAIMVQDIKNLLSIQQTNIDFVQLDLENYGHRNEISIEQAIPMCESTLEAVDAIKSVLNAAHDRYYNDDSSS